MSKHTTIWDSTEPPFNVHSVQLKEIQDSIERLSQELKQS